jgi:hypothetical protein
LEIGLTGPAPVGLPLPLVGVAAQLLERGLVGELVDDAGRV